MIAGILKTKLEAIDADCEGAVIPAINKLYADARYDGSRFRVPSFQAAGALWIDLIARKEREFVKEIARILGAPGVILTVAGTAEVRSFVEGIFSEGRYVERMRIFSEGVGRAAASYGLAFDPMVHRIDIHDAAYRAGAMNALRRARTNVLAEIELLSHSKTPEFVRSVSQWWTYLRVHPWRWLSAIVLILISWLLSKVSAADLLGWLRTW
ncbi:hypothetical protein [Curvibacter sp. PAE-UM]|uniref:hypothetical protein n=1 Tax=Curvibacter sp. PAE-UM TaxID=1714344 RepID=UPI000709BACF|nr:hypothetical protein [Curvibacter sp. PAE-UM]KRH98820.1 hypothetical protein AO057_04880 [Curvibacter sp. PAE-UM]